MNEILTAAWFRQLAEHYHWGAGPGRFFHLYLAVRLAKPTRRGADVDAFRATRLASDGFSRMQSRTIHNQPSSVTAEDGDVLVKGPDDVDVGLSPEAAEETSNRLLEGSMKARGQRHLRNYPHRAR